MDELDIEPEGEAYAAKDYKIPAVLLGVGVVLYLIYGMYRGGVAGLGAMAVALPVQLLIQVALGVVACLLTVKIIGAAFGYVGSAILKLAAVAVFPSAVSIYIPYVGWIVSLLLYWGLLEWLFELEVMETITLVVVLFVVNALAIMLVAWIGLAMVAGR